VNYISKKQKFQKILFCLSLCLIVLVVFGFFNGISVNLNRSFEDNKSENSDLKTHNGLGAFLEWDIYPNLNKKTFTPDTTPGTGDSAIYSFSVSSEANYTLNITAYYDIIKEFTFTSDYENIYPCGAYLLPNGTWYIVDSEGSNYYLGIGTNSENIIWKKIMNKALFNTDLAIAGDNKGEIRIIYTNKIESAPKIYDYLIECLSSDDGGESWTRSIIKNYSFVPEDFAIRGLSVAEFNGNFTYMWGLYNMFNYEIWVAQENSTNVISEWSQAGKLTSLENKNCTYPQVFYNYTDDDGTLLVGYNYENNSRAEFNITMLGNGIGSPGTDNWNIDTESSPLWSNFTHNFNLIDSNVKPTVYCTKDYESNNFFFIDRSQRIIDGSSFDSTINVGIKTAEWGENLLTKSVDYFHPEVEGTFNLYAMNDPKCFSDTVRDRYGRFYRGILDCKTPFTVRGWESQTEAYRRIAYIFNGKDEYGDSRYAKSYYFDLIVTDRFTTLKGNSIIFVDNTPARVEYSTSYDKISPFASFGINDDFSINLNSTEQGDMRFVLKSEDPIISKSNITDETNPIYTSVLCGNGLTNYLFYIESETETSQTLMMTKSTDRGLSWSNPKSIATTSIDNQWGKISAKTEGNSVFLWTSNNKLSEFENVDNFLFFSSDGGDSFIKYNQVPNNPKRAVKAVTDDLICWDTEWNNDTSSLIINKSSDYGFNWEPFINLTLPNYNYMDECSYFYDLKDLVYDSNTKNYTFILSNTTVGGESSSLKPLLSLTISHNASSYFIKNIDISNLSINTDFLSPDSSINFFNIEKYKIDDSNSGKILFTVNQSGSQFKVIYSTAINGINFNEWSCYMELVNHTTIGLNPPLWDILLLNGESPCFCKIISEFNQISVITKSSFTSGLSTEIGAELKGEIKFKGITSNGEIIEDGLYKWELIFTDQAGYETHYSGNLTIDNTFPSLNTSNIITIPADPHPIYQLNLTVPIFESNPDMGVLYYRTNLDTEWTRKTMNSVYNMSSDLTNFTASIPAAQSEGVITIYYYIIINDTCGNILELDNNGLQYSYDRGVFEYIKKAGLTNPTLYDTWNWSYIFSSGGDHLEKVWVNLHFGNGTSTNITISASGDNNNTYSTLIRNDLINQNATYTFNYLPDIGDAEEIGRVDLIRPSIRIEEEIEPPEELDLTEDSLLELSFSVPENSRYIENVYIEYKFNDGSGMHRVNLSSLSSLYRFSFDNISKDATELSYRIYAIDSFNNTYNLNDGETIHINIIPLMPVWEMSAQEQILIPIIAGLIGLISGIIYTYLNSQKSEKIHQNIVQKDLENKSEREKGQETKKDDKDLKTLIINSLKEKRFLTIIFSGSLFLICIFSSVIMLILHLPEGAMLGFTGAFLSSVFLWILLSNQIVERLYRTEKGDTLGRENILLISISCIIFVCLLAIFLIGDTVAWWRVRVNQRSYTFGSVTIPRALVTVFSTFLSSILLLTWSTLREVKNNIKDLKKAKKNNDNPLFVIERREKAISKTIGNVGKKGIIFIAAIGISIVFASDLGTYATQGILMIIPFAIGAIITLFIGSKLLKSRIEDVNLFIYDNYINCPKCGDGTPLSSNYCQNCGEHIIIGKKLKEGIECNKCENINAKESQYCFYCGRQIKKKMK